MDTRTGELMSLTEAYKLPKEDQKHLVELTEEEFEALKNKSLSERAKYASGLNRAERRLAAKRK